MHATRWDPLGRPDARPPSQSARRRTPRYGSRDAVAGETAQEVGADGPSQSGRRAGLLRAGCHGASRTAGRGAGHRGRPKREEGTSAWEAKIGVLLVGAGVCGGSLGSAGGSARSSGGTSRGPCMGIASGRRACVRCGTVDACDWAGTRAGAVLLVAAAAGAAGAGAGGTSDGWDGRQRARLCWWVHRSESVIWDQP